ncbi:MAG: hypothetical protein H7293_09290, partial [Candidatus Saccharibacteria bacterium]|nr:hypothetical protein [Rhodoferax sp.]
LARINAGLEQRFGPGKWAMGFSAASLLLDKKLMAQKNVDPIAVTNAARTLLLAEPAIAAAYTRRELEAGSRADAPFFAAMRNAWHPDVSGEIQFVLKPHWMFGSAAAATHGSPYPYDTQVPLLMYGPTWLQPGRVDAPVAMVDLAPTLSKLLGVPAPSSAVGKLLPVAAP